MFVNGYMHFFEVEVKKDTNTRKMQYKKIIFLLIFGVSSFFTLSKENINIEGKWDFYWKKLYLPQDFEKGQITSKAIKVKVPSSWTNYANEHGHFPAEGYATYRKTIKITSSDNKKVLALYVPPAWSALNLYVNGNKILSKGKIDANGKELKAEMIHDVVVLPVDNKEELEIIAHVSNEVFFLGGFFSHFEIGSFEVIKNKHDIENILFLTLLGSLTIMTVYHLVLFLFRRKEKVAIYFSLLAFLMMLRTSVFGNHLLYEYIHTVLGMSIKVQTSIYYGATFSMIIAGLWYVKSLYPSEGNYFIIKYYTWAMLGVIALIIILPVKLVFANMLWTSIPFIPGAIYLIYILALAIIKKRKQFSSQIVGIAFLLIAGINDVLYLQNIQLTGLEEAIPIGFVLFLLVQMLILARNFSSTYSEVEELTYNLEMKVLERTSKLNEQRKELKKRNERINESIDYASKIQHAMLPSSSILKNKFPESFLFYQPKDVLSGDFYFIGEVMYQGNKCTVVVAADCTGHGIPGALMSMMGNALLNRYLETINNDPGTILMMLDKGIQEALKQKETNNHDGMDISIVYIDETNKQVHFSAANSYIAFIKDEELSTIRGEKSGVGGVKDEETIFKTRTLEWKESMQIYLFSDGFQDQFGGSKGKKFQKGKFHQLLKEISSDDGEKQFSTIQNSFNYWKGEYEQVDDVLVIGVKVS